MNTLLRCHYYAEDMKQIEHAAVTSSKITLYDLMERAAEAVVRKAQTLWLQASPIGVLAGKGNNGGDAYCVARRLHQAGIPVKLYQVGDHHQLREEAKEAQRRAIEAGVPMQEFNGEVAQVTSLWIDGLLGTGLQNDVHGAFRVAIEFLNQSHVPVLSIDVPSGLCANTGRALGQAVRATATVSLMASKLGLWTLDGRNYSGQIFVDDLGFPEASKAVVPRAMTLMPEEVLAWTREPRHPSSHKGSFGHVLVIGGSPGMWGAPRMAAEAALRVGSGRVTVATHAAHAQLLSLGRPEIMSYGVKTKAELEALLTRATVIVVGPGLAENDEWAQEMAYVALSSDKPKVVDAGAFSYLMNTGFKRDDWILTPHPKEAQRLLKMAETPMTDRLAAVKSLQSTYGGVAVLKGSGSLAQARERVTGLCTFGNPGMATAGMGDVLSGVIGGCLAQGLSLESAAEAGVLLHALAGDKAAGQSPRGLLATDLFDSLRMGVNGCL